MGQGARGLRQQPRDAPVVRFPLAPEAVARVVAEKAAGRDAGGSVDLVWINGPNFLAMREQKLLHGPFAERLPNWRLVDTVKKRSNLIDFTIPHEGYESPWRMAQIVFIHDADPMLAREIENRVRVAVGLPELPPAAASAPAPAEA